MTTGQRPPPGSPGGRRPPTIELQATEVDSSETAADAEQPQPSGAPRQPGPGSSGGGRSRIAWLPPGVPWRLVGAGATGAAGVLLLLLLLWAAGLLPRAQDPMIALAPRLGAIETQLRELAARPQPATVDPKAIDELRAQLAKVDPTALDGLTARLAVVEAALTARLAKLETALAAPQAPVTDAVLVSRVSATDDAVKALAAQVAQLTARIDAVAASLTELQNAARASSADRSAIATLTNKIVALEQSSQQLRDELAKRAIANVSDRAVRLAMLASALRGAVERGSPFAAELAIVKPLAADAAALAALEPYAASGLPSQAALGRELAALIEPMRQAAGSASRDNFIERLQANAQKLVRIRPVDEIPGDDPVAILSRIEARAAPADLAGALAELGKLPPAVRAPAQGWIAKVQARQAAAAAANRFAADALAALKTTP